MMTVPRAVVRAVFFGTMTMLLLVPYLVMLGMVPRHRHRVAGFFYKGCLAATGVKVTVHGKPARNAALYAANHASYLDIPILGSVLSESVFVAKHEVASWPLFGFLARIARTEFVSRTGAQATDQCARLAQRIKRGEGLILFPEGTSTDGSRVRPFKSALFGALENLEGEALVQPVTIAYSHTSKGAFLDQAARERYTWFGDMSLAPHLWGVFGERGCHVHVIFHAPVIANEFPDRKALARHCETQVRGALGSLLKAPEYETMAAPERVEAPAQSF